MNEGGVKMQVYVSNREIEQIAEGLVHVACGKPPPKRIEIVAVAVYLGLTVRYEKFAESTKNRISERNHRPRQFPAVSMRKQPAAIYTGA